jgi:hypothetical protein
MTPQLPTMPECSISVRNPAQLITVTPYVIGFHPTDSVVVVGLIGSLIAFAARHDLPPPGEHFDPGPVAAVVADQGVNAAAVIGYGPPDPVTATVLRQALALRNAGVDVLDVLRVTEGRWWSFICDEPRCCPPEGNPCNPPHDPVAAAAVFKGLVALPDRKALVAQVAPIGGTAREAMAAATTRAQARLTRLRTGRGGAGRGGAGRDGAGRGDSGGASSVRRAGREAVRDAEARYRATGVLTDDEAAWLGLLLVDPVVLDHAIDRCGPEPWRIDLWNAMVRRLEPPYAAGPAALMALAAWRDGNGALARVALDRGLREEPGHRMLRLLDGILASGTGPHVITDLAPPRRAEPEQGGGEAREVPRAA